MEWSNEVLLCIHSPEALPGSANTSLGTVSGLETVEKATAQVDVLDGLDKSPNLI